MSTTTYCPRCGTPMEIRPAEGREREVCPACGLIFYRNPVPAVGVVVGMGDRVVLVRRKFEPQAGAWGLPAGYMELDESAEEAAIRECHEETGLLIQIDHLLGVYSFGSGAHSGLIVIYAADAVGGELTAGDDATEAAAFSPDALPEPFAFRTHLQAIEQWRRSRRNVEARPLHLPDAPGATLRPAHAADAEALLDLLVGADAAPERRLAADAHLHDWLHDPDRPILVVDVDGAPAGVALLALHQTLHDWYATLDGLVVAPAYRGRGLGIALTSAAVGVARERGCTTVHRLVSQRAPEVDEFLAARGFAAGGTLIWRLDEETP